MTEPLAYLNGAFLPVSQVHLSPFDAGFMWGATVTDRVRTFRHAPFLLAEHVERFQQSCYGAFVPQPLADTHLIAIASELIAHNARLLGESHELSLIMFATPGLTEQAGPPTLAMHTVPLPFSHYRHLFTQGASLAFSRVVDQSYVEDDEEYGIDPRVKHRSRLHWWAAREQLRTEQRARSTDIPLFCDPRDDCRFTETPLANVLVVVDGIVYSPPRRRILNGISLGVVEQLCGELGIEFVELSYDDTDTDAIEFSFPLFVEAQTRASVQEVLLTGTTFCIAGASRYVHLGLPYTIPWPGPYLRRLQAAWSARVGVNIEAQFLATS